MATCFYKKVRHPDPNQRHIFFSERSISGKALVRRYYLHKAHDIFPQEDSICYTFPEIVRLVLWVLLHEAYKPPINFNKYAKSYFNLDRIVELTCFFIILHANGLQGKLPATAQGIVVPY